jgi:anti-sigma B factor antagonist
MNMRFGCEIMKIDQKIINNIPVLEVSGKIDATTSEILKRTLDSLIKDNYANILIDLAYVEYISSGGLRILLATLKEVRPNQGDLKLAALQPSVSEVLEIVGFTKLFKIYPSQADALSQMGA